MRIVQGLKMQISLLDVRFSSYIYPSFIAVVCFSDNHEIILHLNPIIVSTHAHFNFDPLIVIHWILFLTRV